MGFSGGGDTIDIGIAVTPKSDAEQLLDAFRAKVNALRASLDLASKSGGDIGATQTASINQAIGAFTRFGQLVDATNAKALAGFRAEGDAISAYLVKLGATDAELNKIGSTIATVEQRAGKMSIALNSGVGPQTDAKFNSSSFAIRRGADAVSQLAFAADAGSISAKSLAPELGSVAIAAASLAGRSLLAATGIGAVVTIGLTVIGVLTEVSERAKEADKSLEDFSGLNAQEIRARAESLRDSVQGLTRLQSQLGEITHGLPDFVKVDLNAVRGLSAALKSVGIKAEDIVDVGQVKSAIDRIQERIVALQGVQIKASKTASEAEAKADKDLLNQRIRDAQAVEVARIAAVQGEAAARKKQREFDLQNELVDIAESGARQDAQIAARNEAQRKFDAETAKDAAEEAQKAAEARAAGQVRLSDAVAARETANAKAVQDKSNAIAQAARDARSISQQQLIATELAAQISEIKAVEKADLEATGRRIAIQNQLLDATVDPEKRAKIIADRQALVDQLGKITLDANGKVIATTTDASAKIAAVQRDLVRTVEQANIATLRDQGRFVDAAQIQVQKEFQDAITEALALAATGDATGLVAAAVLGQRIGAAIASAASEQISRDLGKRLSADDAVIRRAQILVDTRQISTDDARERILTALRDQSSALLDAIQQQQKVVDATPGNPAELAQLDALKDKWLELQVTIDKTSDTFFDLKTASIDALTSGLAQGIDDSVTGAKSLSEVWATSADSIVHSIQRIISQLLAQLAVQKLLGLFSGSNDPLAGVGTLEDIKNLGIQIIGGHDAGGILRGRRPGRDSNLAWFTDGEFIVNPESTRRHRALLEAINADTVVRRSNFRGYAEGGMVGAAPVGSAAGTWTGRSDVTLHLDTGIIAGFMRSSEGQQIQIQNARRNTHTWRSFFGRG